MIHKDVQISGVTRNKHNELVYKIRVKEEDYTNQDYEALRAIWQEGVTMDIEIKGAEATTQTVNAVTGEIINESSNNPQ